MLTNMKSQTKVTPIYERLKYEPQNTHKLCLLQQIVYVKKLHIMRYSRITI